MAREKTEASVAQDASLQEQQQQQVDPEVAAKAKKLEDERIAAENKRLEALGQPRRDVHGNVIETPGEPAKMVVSPLAPKSYGALPSQQVTEAPKP